jgi:hypothetical protein
MNGKTPTKGEREWLNAITGLGCIVCLREHEEATPASPHHIDGSTKPGAHRKTIPLCWAHHQGNSDGTKQPFISRHPFKARFVKAYGDEYSLLADCRERLGWEDAA